MTTSLHAMVEGLGWKYRELVWLLSTRLAMQATGATRFPEREGPARRARMAALAARFPGALRELERSTLGALQDRLEALDAVARGSPVPAWAEAVWRYHEALRAILEAKRAGAAPSGRPSHLAVAQVARELGRSELEILRDITGRHTMVGENPVRRKTT